ncbi:MAG: hypothetical protein JWP91_795 [Fibrobacteres bacterium]|nr:hypothetical protein [Fibrobacterota bacterium]
MEKQYDENPEPPETPSWTPDPVMHPVHSKMDWISEVHFKCVRGVEVHSEEEKDMEPHSA